MVAFSVKKDSLPARVHQVNLSAMSYIKNREGKPEQSWKDYYITIIGFPEDVEKEEASPLTISIGRVKGEKGNVQCTRYRMCFL